MNTYIVAIRAGTKLLTLEMHEPTQMCAMVAAMNKVWDTTGVEPEDQKVLSCREKSLIH